MNAIKNLASTITSNGINSLNSIFNITIDPETIAATTLALETLKESALSWFANNIQKPVPNQEQIQKSLPQQILDTGFYEKCAGDVDTDSDNNCVDRAIDILSLRTPFDSKAYCDRGCAYIKKQTRPIRGLVHPDNQPFQAVHPQEKATELAHRASAAVNIATDTLCNSSTQETYCRWQWL